MPAIGLLSGRAGAKIQIHHQQLGYNGGRSRLDLQISMDYRNDFQKIETEFSVAFFLFGHGKRHKNAGLVYTHSPLVAQCNQGIIEKQESIFDRSGTNTDTPDKPFGLDVDSNRGQARLLQAQDKSQQESCNRTNVPLLMGGRFFKNRKQICKQLNMNDMKTKSTNIEFLSVDSDLHYKYLLLGSTKLMR